MRLGQTCVTSSFVHCAHLTARIVQSVVVWRLQDRRPRIDGLNLSRGKKSLSSFYSSDGIGESQPPPPVPAAHEADRRQPYSDVVTNQCQCTATVAWDLWLEQRQLYVLTAVHTDSSTYWQLYVLTAVLTDSCTYWKLYLLTAVLTDSCTYWQLYLLTAVLTHTS